MKNKMLDKANNFNSPDNYDEKLLNAINLLKTHSKKESD
jgi:hypothetical protein